ncbi:MAG TPA: DUF898 family protein, partial [Paracoccaceae bacterium]|nr:DUF898 family protein [Paracoccaceae bacterium]
MNVTDIPAVASERRQLEIDYVGEGHYLFWLYAKLLALTLITLGIYRFWMKARLRRYYWSAIRIAGQPLEFSGTGLEMLIGFLIAVVFLAIYLGLFNLAIGFAGLAVFGSPLAINLSILAVLPLGYYAAYRARRYLLARTRWRGIRFGMEQGALDYMWRALLYALVTAATLGFMFPWMQFRLRKFAVDRSFYGDLRFQQAGAWTGFLKPWLWVVAAAALIFLASYGTLRDPGNGALYLLVSLG